MVKKAGCIRGGTILNIEIKNCNSIDEGKISINEGALNVKYAINGTGKTTIANALMAFVNNDETKKKSLIPFRYVDASDDHVPEVSGYDGISKINIFNEQYVQDYVYQTTELIKNSFEIFVKSPDYDKHINEIERLLNSINATFQSHPDLEELIMAFSQFIEGFGKAKNGYSSTGAIGKGLGKGNIIENIPEELVPYAPYLTSENNVKWIKWQIDGKTYLDVAEQCPYCSGKIDEKKENILKVSEIFDPKVVDQINKMLSVFEQLMPYFDEDTQNKLKEIIKNSTGITDVQKQYLVEIKQQIEVLLSQLYRLKHLGFHSLKKIDKIGDELSNYRIDITYYTHLNSEMMKEKVSILNNTLDEVLSKAGLLQGEVAKQKALVKSTIETYKTEINDFLYYSGYKYIVDIVDNDGDSENYRLILKHIESSNELSEVDSHLSFGERNALALVLFMYNAIKENPDLIVLDDPISSFDGNKKFAILNMLFMGKHCFRDKTVLLLTHEFSTIIDVIYNLPYNFNPAPHASFLAVKNGILTEKEITKKDIASFGKIADVNIHSEIDTLNKLIYLRRLLEIIKPGGLEWQLISNVFKKREHPEIHENNGKRLMTEQEIEEATEWIRCNYIPEFNYEAEYKKTCDAHKLKALYDGSLSNYEKLQIYRIQFNDNHPNSVIKKYINEAFHVENDYLFQLNPIDFDTVPQYIIEECNKYIATIK